MFETISIQIEINTILINAVRIDTRHAMPMFSETEMKIVLELATYQTIEMMNILEVLNHDTTIMNRIALKLVNMTLNRTIMLKIFLLLSQMLEIFLETSTSHLNHLLPQKDLIQKS
jgi:hypothetical protein